MEILIGLVIGFAIGGTGVGGGTLTAPALVLLMHYSPRAAVGTALVFATGVKIFASAEYLFRSQVNYKVLGMLLAGGLPGALIGALILEKLHAGKANQYVLLGIGAVVMFTAVSSILKTQKAETEPVEKKRDGWLPFLAFPIGLETGFSSAGSGALGTILLFQVTSLSPSMVVGTDLLFGLSLSAIGGGIHALAGATDWSALAKLVPAGIVGSMIGVRVCNGLSKTKLRKSILVCAALIGFTLVVKGVQGML